MNEIIVMMVTAMFGLTASVVYSIYDRQKINKRQNAEIMLKDIYLPLFMKIEKNMYIDISEEYAEELSRDLQKIIDKRYEYLETKLYIISIKFIDNTKNNIIDIGNYQELCGCIDYNYERCKKTLGLPLRNKWHKIKLNQMTKSSENLYMIWIDSILVITFISLGIGIVGSLGILISNLINIF